MNWGGGENPPSAVKTAYVYFLLFLFLYLLYVVGLYGMNNLWKVLITFCVLAVFVFVFAFVLAYFISGSSIPVFGGGKIAVIPVHGVILSAGCGDSVFTQDSCVSSGGLSRRLREADADSSVDAIILDIYSGGGQVVASREIMREVRKTKKPVVAWIGEVGASGAYYIASAADSIVADDNSLTGSIGVVMTIPHYYGLMEKVGVNVTVVKTGDSKDIGSPYRPMTEEENMMFLNMTETVYGSFISDVAVNRDLNEDYLRSISGGRIYLGVEAKEKGLVDVLGGFDSAVEVAKNLAGLKGDVTLERPEKSLSISDLLK